MRKPMPPRESELFLFAVAVGVAFGPVALLVSLAWIVREIA